MEQWSVLRNKMDYVHYNRNPRDYCKLDIRSPEPHIIVKYIIN